MIDIFQKLEMKVENDIVIPPYFRQDIEQMADLAEEVVRFYGYDKLDTTLIKADTTLGVKNKEQKIEDKILETLQNNGLSEIYTYGFINEKELDKSNVSEELKKVAICIKNPLNDEYKPEKIVIGLPKNMDGSEGFRVDATHEFADALKTIYDGEIVFWDERLSSVGAARFLNETNTRGKKRKDVLDTVAACIILDGYLSSQKNK